MYLPVLPTAGCEMSLSRQHHVVSKPLPAFGNTFSENPSQRMRRCSSWIGKESAHEQDKNSTDEFEIAHLYYSIAAAAVESIVLQWCASAVQIGLAWAFTCVAG